MAFIGVDLHTNSFAVCRLEADGREQLATYLLAAADLARFCFGLDGNDEVAVEATGNSAWFCGENRPCVGRIVAVNPKQFQAIRKSVKKTGRNDACALVFFLSRDMLPETRLKSVAERELASLVHARDVLVRQRTRLLNKIHALYVRHGVKLKKESLSSKRALQRLEVARFSALEQVELKIVRDQSLSLTGALAEIDAAIESADKLAAYLGIVPRVSQSNNTDRRGHITKRGNRLMRTTPVQCTLTAIRYSGYLNGFYRRVKERRGASKAIVATARKPLTIIYNTLRNGWVFQDFTAFKIAEKTTRVQLSMGNRHRRRKQ